MKAMNSRSIVAVAALVALVALLAGVGMITTHKAKPPACPHCGSQDTFLFQQPPGLSQYRCNACKDSFLGPAQPGFSWAAALEDWLD